MSPEVADVQLLVSTPSRLPSSNTTELPRDRDEGEVLKGGGQSAVSPDVRECINKSLERGEMHVMRNTTVRNHFQTLLLETSLAQTSLFPFPSLHQLRKFTTPSNQFLERPILHYPAPT